MFHCQHSSLVIGLKMLSSSDNLHQNFQREQWSNKKKKWTNAWQINWLTQLKPGMSECEKVTQVSMSTMSTGFTSLITIVFLNKSDVMSNGSYFYETGKFWGKDFNQYIYPVLYIQLCLLINSKVCSFFWLTHSAGVRLYCLLLRHFNHLIIMSTKYVWIHSD